MMARDIPSVPITTLAGVTSLTDLLPEMPLPMPLPNSLSNKSLLFHPRVTEEALNLLRVNNDLLVPQLIQSLIKTSADHIVLKDDYQKNTVINSIDKDIPILLKTILKSNSNVFHTRPDCDTQLPQIRSMNVDQIDETFENCLEDHVMINHNNNNKILNNNIITDVKDGISAGKVDSNSYSNNSNHNFENYITSNNNNNNNNDNIDPNSNSNSSTNVNNNNKNDNKSELPRKFSQFKQPFVLIKRIPDDELKGSSKVEKHSSSRRRVKPVQNRNSSGSEYSEEEGDDSADEYEEDKKPSKTRPLSLKSKSKANNLTNNVFSSNTHKEIDMSNFKPKIKKIERLNNSRMKKLSSEEVMESEVFVKFNRLIDTVIRKKSDSITNKEIRSDIQELCNESAKLKSIGAMEYMSVTVLLQLLSVLEKIIEKGQYISPIAETDDHDDFKHSRPEHVMEKVLIAAHASLTCLNIMTSPNMSKRIHLEDIIEIILLFVKYQLTNTIFPTFDPIYSLDSKRKDNSKKKKVSISQSREKNITIFYRHIHELVHLFAELFSLQKMPDHLIIHATSMSLAPFFVENISELQLSSLKLATEIFTKYDAHRNMLIDEILISISRLPTGKRNLRSYRLNGEEQIQMLTALILQLTQSVVSCQEMSDIDDDTRDKKIESDGALIIHKFDTMQSVSFRFLTTFLEKCGSKLEDVDFRPMFENFVQDLLTTLNKPEWPASELMLTYLGKMLMSKLRTRGVDMTLRVASLDYLGLITARLKRDSFVAKSKENIIDQIIQAVREDIENENEKESNSLNDSTKKLTTDDKEWFLQKILLDYLAVNSSKDNCYDFARFFYIAKWIKHLKEQLKKTNKKHTQKRNTVDCENVRSTRKLNHSNNSQNGRKDNSDHTETEDTEEFGQNRDLNSAFFEKRRKLLINKLHPYHKSSNSNELVLKTYIDYDKAELITQYLSLNSLFSKNCDNYLEVINGQLAESAIAIRTKAMKCLSTIIDADPTVLTKTNLRYAVSNLCLDASASVREAAVDLIGKCILSKHDLITCYYETLSNRILDTAVSVRKRVIKILKDLCYDYPEYDCIPEICLKMMQRVNDEEVIRKLIMEVFQNMWFSPVKENPLDTELLQKKINNIINVIEIIRDGRYDVFEQLLTTLFKPKDEKNETTKVGTLKPAKTIIKASNQIVNYFIETILVLEENNSKGIDTNDESISQKLVSSITALYLFAKVRPQLLINHLGILQPYLSLKCRTLKDLQILNCVAKILELVVPLIENPGDLFLSSLEEDAIKILVLKPDRLIISSCVALLAAVINVTKNYKLICDVFRRFYTLFVNQYMDLKTNVDKLACAYMQRTIFSIGSLVRYFDLTNRDIVQNLLPDTLKEELFEMFMYFLLNRKNDTNLQLTVLRALGRICIRYPELMLSERLKEYYLSILKENHDPVRLKIEVLQNFELYLTEEENRLLKQDQEWEKESKEMNLKDMGDVYSGITSSVIQTYLADILNSYLDPAPCSRNSTIKVVKMIIQHGLVLPFQIIPYLVCMCTDIENRISVVAESLIADIDKRYPNYIHTKAIFGIKLSYQLQMILQSSTVIRGIIIGEKRAIPLAANNCLYSLIRGARQQRRALISNMLKQFDDKSSTLPSLLYFADNLAYYPYAVQDEVLFIIHHIDIMISISGTNILQSVKEQFLNNKLLNTNIDGIDVSVKIDDDDDDMDNDTLMQKLPEDITALENCLNTAQGCYLLLILKQYLKQAYGVTDSKITQYSPSEPVKVYEKAISRKNNTLFDPKSILKKLTHDTTRDTIEKRKHNIVQQYIHFKSLMLQFDKDESDEGDTKVTNNSKANNSVIENNDESVQITELESPIKLKLSKSDIRKSIKANLKKANMKKKRKRYNSSSTEESEVSCDDYD